MTDEIKGLVRGQGKAPTVPPEPMPHVEPYPRYAGSSATGYTDTWRSDHAEHCPGCRNAAEWAAKGSAPEDAPTTRPYDLGDFYVAEIYGRQMPAPAIVQAAYFARPVNATRDARRAAQVARWQAEAEAKTAEIRREWDVARAAIAPPPKRRGRLMVWLGATRGGAL